MWLIIQISTVPEARIRERIKEVLQKSNPFKQQRFGREDCLVCKQAGKGPCNAHSVTYEIECQGCENKYVVRQPEMPIQEARSTRGA